MIDSSVPSSSSSSAAKPVTVASSESNEVLTSNVSVLDLKIELSPSQQLHQQQAQDHQYEPQRQTVLMWGSTQHQNSLNSTPPAACVTPSTNGSAVAVQSPNATPTTRNGGHYGSDYKSSSRLTGNIILSPETLNGAHMQQQMVLTNHHPTAVKWTERGGVGGSHLKSTYYESSLPETPGVDAQQQSQSYGGQHHHSHLEGAAAKLNGTGSGEVWSAASSTAYHSQYQYFTYPPATHHHHNPTSTQ